MMETTTTLAVVALVAFRRIQSLPYPTSTLYQLQHDLCFRQTIGLGRNASTSTVDDSGRTRMDDLFLLLRTGKGSSNSFSSSSESRVSHCWEIPPGRRKQQHYHHNTYQQQLEKIGRLPLDWCDAPGPCRIPLFAAHERFARGIPCIFRTTTTRSSELSILEDPVICAILANVVVASLMCFAIVRFKNLQTKSYKRNPWSFGGLTCISLQATIQTTHWISDKGSLDIYIYIDTSGQVEPNVIISGQP